MSTTLRRGISLLVLGALLFIGAGLIIGTADDRQDQLQENGTRVQGTVVDAHNPLRGPSSVTFRYRVQGETYEEHITGSNAYSEGESVTVYVDPANPRSATLGGEQPQSTPTYYFTLLVVVASLFLLAVGAFTLWRAWRER